MTAESMLSKRPVSRITEALFLLLNLFSSHIYCSPKKKECSDTHTQFNRHTSFHFQRYWLCSASSANVQPEYLSDFATVQEFFFFLMSINWYSGSPAEEDDSLRFRLGFFLNSLLCDSLSAGTCFRDLSTTFI